MGEGQESVQGVQRGEVVVDDAGEEILSTTFGNIYAKYNMV